MNTIKIRHIAVALGLVAVAAVTGASAAGFARHNAPAARTEALPVPAATSVKSSSTPPTTSAMSSSTHRTTSAKSGPRPSRAGRRRLPRATWS